MLLLELVSCEDDILFIVKKLNCCRMTCLQFLIFSGSLFGRLSAGKMAEESVEIGSPVFVLLFIES